MVAQGYARDFREYMHLDLNKSVKMWIDNSEEISNEVPLYLLQCMRLFTCCCVCATVQPLYLLLCMRCCACTSLLAARSMQPH
jgi:hypothetical protein